MKTTNSNLTVNGALDFSAISTSKSKTAHSVTSVNKVDTSTLDKYRTKYCYAAHLKDIANPTLYRSLDSLTDVQLSKLKHILELNDELISEYYWKANPFAYDKLFVQKALENDSTLVFTEEDYKQLRIDGYFILEQLKRVFNFSCTSNEELVSTFAYILDAEDYDFIRPYFFDLSDEDYDALLVGMILMMQSKVLTFRHNEPILAELTPLKESFEKELQLTNLFELEHLIDALRDRLSKPSTQTNPSNS